MEASLVEIVHGHGLLPMFWYPSINHPLEPCRIPHAIATQNIFHGFVVNIGSVALLQFKFKRRMSLSCAWAWPASPCSQPFSTRPFDSQLQHFMAMYKPTTQLKIWQDKRKSNAGLLGPHVPPAISVAHRLSRSNRNFSELNITALTSFMSTNTLIHGYIFYFTPTFVSKYQRRHLCWVDSYKRLYCKRN